MKTCFFPFNPQIHQLYISYRFLTFKYRSGISFVAFLLPNSSFVLYLLNLHFSIHHWYNVCFIFSLKYISRNCFLYFNLQTHQPYFSYSFTTFNYFSCTLFLLIPPVNYSVLTCLLHFGL